MSRGIAQILIDENYEHFKTFFENVLSEYKREQRKEAAIIGGATSGAAAALGGIIAAIALALAKK